MNGFVGVWLTRTGEPHPDVKLRGVVDSLLVRGGKVYGLTDIGDHVALALNVLERGYCS